MALFNRLPGFVRSPPGLERKVLRHLPSIFPAGLIVLLAPSAGLRIAEQAGSGAYTLASLNCLELTALSLLLPYCSLTVFIAPAAFTVMVMKGPGYVADAYCLEEEDGPEGHGRATSRGWW